MDWQTLVVALTVIVAAAYLARRAYRSFRRPGCGDGCGSCAGRDGPPGEADKLVQIRIRKGKDR